MATGSGGSDDVDRTTAPSRLLVGVGLLLLAFSLGAAINGQDTLAGTLAVLGVGVAVLATFAPRIRGPVEMGPSGVRFELERLEAATLSAELGERLGDIGTADLALGQPAGGVSDKTHAEVSELLRSIEGLVRRIEATQSDIGPEEPLTAEARLEIARGMLAQRRWRDAAVMLDQYVEAEPDDWEVQFARGAAHANSRGGAEADRSALRAFNDALAFVPRDQGRHWLPRFFGYRGAMLKRLGRYVEAENDLRIARSLATDSDDAHDIDYNLAAVYALTGRPDEAMKLVKSLQGTRFVGGIKSHVHDYFDALRDDPEFVAIVGKPDT
jgi:tetratricopeptide (TPR) repeat protein